MLGVDSVIIDRSVLIFVLSASWIFIYIGIQANEDENDNDVTTIDIIAFWYANIIVVLGTIYALYRSIIQWR